MKSCNLLLAILIGAFLLILFGASILQVPEATAVNYEEPKTSPITVTDNYTTYFPIILKTPVLYFDDFSDPASAWPTGDINHISLSYQGGEYEIKIRKDFWWGGAAPPLGDISNYSVESEARLYTGSEGVYGLVFDRVDWDHFYVFVIIPDSQLYAVLRNDSGWVNIVPFTSSTAIKSGSAVNLLKVERVGDKISVLVNDQFLTTTSDSTFSSTSSEVGLFSQSFNEQPIAARFDNFAVRQIDGVTTSMPSQKAIHTELSGQGVGGIRLER